jgi:type II secretory pathway predicted ATPase ExeA
MLVGESNLQGRGTMYNDYFGFRESPFNLTPNPDFFYANPVYLEAYASLRYATESKKGFIAVTGEVGTGKTTLLRKLMRDLRQTTRSAFVFNTSLTFEELLQVILHDLGLPAQAKDKLAMLRELNDYLIEQLQKHYVVCLLIDEAQNLSYESLEGLRLLSNFETNREKLLQIVLMGQPELNAKLDRPNLRQLKQRIAVHCEITPLEAQEVGSYIGFRLRTAGYGGKDLFDGEAVREIAVYSKGIPRLINVLCDNALLMAFAASRRTVSVDLIKEVARDLRLRPEPERNRVKAASTRLPSNIRREVFISEAVDWRVQRRARRWGRVVAGFCLILLVSLVIAYISGPKTFFAIPGQPFALFAPEMAEERLLVSRQETVPQEIQAEVGNAAPKKIEAELKWNNDRTIVRYGSTIYEIAIATYGVNAVLGMDLIKEFNPRITNLNSVAAGQEILLPGLTEESLVRPQDDGSYRLIVGSFLSRREADEFALRIEKLGYHATITATRVANDLLLHRLEIADLESLEHARQTLETALKREWLTR